MNPALGHRSYWCTLTQYWFNVGPLFATQAQYEENIGPVQTYRIYAVGLQWWIDVCQSSTTLAQYKINIAHVFRMYLLNFIK